MTDCFAIARITPWSPFISADISICNLESPLTDEGEAPPTKPYVFRGRPENVVGLTYSGIDVVSLGNNHIVDYGEVGMLQTQQLCDDAGIPHFGAGRNDREALAPLVSGRPGSTGS